MAQKGENDLQTPQSTVNYLYFSLFFVTLLLTSGSSILLKESLSGSRTFFFLYTTGQAALETLCLASICYLISRYFNKTTLFTFIGCTFLFLVIHLIDFLMDRILDLTIWETLRCFVFNESLDHFFYLLDASGIPFWVWGLMLFALLLLPFIGIAFYKVTLTIAEKRPLFIRKEWVFQTFICTPVALLFWDVTASRVIHPDAYTCFIKSLPWKWTFLQPDTIHLPLAQSFATLPSEEEIQKAIHLSPPSIRYRPNIYLFIIESLREDCITPQIAPHLSQFKEEHCHFDLALSNGNGSHLSWFSIFHSQYPYFWNDPQIHHWQKGSPALQLLKKWGYQIRVYSSAQLNYYGIETTLFGENVQLLDSYQTFHHTAPLSAADTDRQALDTMQRDLKEHAEWQEGQCIICFLDSTHFHYTWPIDFTPPFTPFSSQASYFQLFQSARKIEEIKNRYKNAVAYVDSLFALFEQSQTRSDAIVIVTGDHGEEFFEHGHLFHGSHLTHEQTNIPLYMKLGSTHITPLPQIVTQMDIFPTILHYLSGKTIPFLQGTSILDATKWPYGIIARFNGGKTPVEFCIHNGTNKLITQFENKENIFASKSLTIRSICNRYDRSLMEHQEELNTLIQNEFGPMIRHLLVQTDSLEFSKE